MSASAFSLQGRRAFVSGASRGIGRAIACALNDAGATTVLCGRGRQGLEQTAARLPNPAIPTDIVELDVTRESDVIDYFREAREAGRAPDIVVNNAGIINRSKFLDSTTDGWRQVLDVNLNAAYVISREASRAMVAARFGRIIMIASILSLQGKRAATAYTASKHGVLGLTRALAAELGPEGVTVNAVCPGYIRTDINVTLQQDTAFDAKICAATPVGRWGMPEDVAHAVLFLATSGASYVNGHALVVDGGMTATH